MDSLGFMFSLKFWKSLDMDNVNLTVPDLYQAKFYYSGQNKAGSFFQQ